MLRPLLVNDAGRARLRRAAALPPLHTDEGKVSQILRNFISNALKFTERGEVRVSARAISLIAGRGASRHCWPKVSAWLAPRSD